MAPKWFDHSTTWAGQLGQQQQSYSTLSWVSTEMGDHSQLLLSWYVISHSDEQSAPGGQFGLLSSAEQEMSTGQRAVAVLFGWEGNPGYGIALDMRHRLVYPPIGSRDQKRQMSIPPMLLFTLLTVHITPVVTTGTNHCALTTSCS